MSMVSDIPILEKQPAESRIFTFDFSANMADDESIASINSFTDSPTAELTISEQSYSGKQVQARIAGGTADTVYKLTIVVTTDNTPTGNILEGEANLFVRDT